MAKATTIKEALGRFEEKNGTKAAECTVVKLLSEKPPIEKMDASLSTLTCCEQLSLSTNAIEKIANLNGLKQLKILSLARNQIKSLTGLEAVGDTLEQLWISHNYIEKLKGVNVLKKLQTLRMVNNSVKDLSEYLKLNELPCLVELDFRGNPLEETWADSSQTQQSFLAYTTKTFRTLKKLDGEPIVRQDDE